MEDNAKSKILSERKLAGAGLGAAAIAMMFAWRVKPYGIPVALIILLLFGCFMGGYFLWQRRKRSQARGKFESALSQEAARTPREIKDPKRQADLESLRRRFLDGIKVYQSKGKSVYDFPWYVIIGEPGSGKTEAIRHSNLSFHENLQEPMQGIGGTTNMDWWFTKHHGVILDTAGKLVFPEVGSDTVASPQWQEFLKLLKQHRPNCPINGLILVLSVDSLISDSAEAIRHKAGRIARQLEVVQDTLDVRFPVFLLVTKCDKLTGFREYFAHIAELAKDADPDIQDQMLGWSNPDPLDTVFRPDQVDQHLEQVLQRLRRRRLGLLRDPSPTRGARSRRTDEVDALFALPKSLSLIAPRLRRYLETIFVAGEFSSKPVFLRGIYFTSAMQVGADLDEAVWAALGRPAEAVGVKSVQDDFGSPFFLRYVFLEKVFKEWGLVTRASNTRKMLRNRKLVSFGGVSAFLLLLLLLALYGWSELDKNVKSQHDIWAAAASSEGFPGEDWNPVVRPRPLDSTAFDYAGATKIAGGDLGLSLAQFHLQLRDSAETSVVPWMFLPLQWLKRVSVNDRKEAQEIVFERSVVRPLLNASRKKMQAAETDSGPQISSQAEALKSLVRLEMDAAQNRQLDGTSSKAAFSSYLYPLLCFVTETNVFPQSADLEDVFFRTYSSTHQGKWPAEKLSAGNTLATNLAIKLGLVRFFKNVQGLDQDLVQQQTNLLNVQQRVVAFKNEETRLHKASEPGATLVDSPLLILSLTGAKQQLDLALEEARRNNLFTERTNTLEGHAQDVAAKRAKAGHNAIQEIGSLLPPKATPVGNATLERIRKGYDTLVGDYPLVQEIRLALTNRLSQLTSSPVKEVGVAATTSDIDTNFLHYWGTTNTARSYASRFQSYTNAFNFRQMRAADIMDQIGKEWAFLDRARTNAAEINLAAADYRGGYGDELRRTMNFLLAKGSESISGNFMDGYIEQVDKQLKALEAPSAQATFASLAGANSLFTNVNKDLNAARGKVPDPFLVKLNDLPRRLDETRSRLAQKYAQNASDALNLEMGFPVFRDFPPRKTLTRDDLIALNQTVSKLRSEVSVLTNYPPQPFKLLEARLTQCEAMLAVLVDRQGRPATYDLVLDPISNENKEVIRRITALAISEDGQAPARGISIKTTWPLLRVDQKLVITSKRLPESATMELTDTIPEWAGLRFITDPQFLAQPEGQERTNWTASLRIGSASWAVVKVQLNFKQPLPALTNWPVSTDW